MQQLLPQLPFTLSAELFEEVHGLGGIWTVRAHPVVGIVREGAIIMIRELLLEVRWERRMWIRLLELRSLWSEGAVCGHGALLERKLQIKSELINLR